MQARGAGRYSTSSGDLQAGSSKAIVYQFSIEAHLAAGYCIVL